MSGDREERGTARSIPTPAAPAEPRDRDDAAGDGSAARPGRTVAVNLRALRAQAGLTLLELARVAKIGKSTLAQIESGNANPSIDTLFALAGALGVALTDLLAEPTPKVRVLRRGSVEPMSLDEAGVRISLLQATGRHGTSEIFLLELEQGARRVAAAHARGAVEHVFVVAGRLRTGPTASVVDLEPGDLLSFDADVAHVYEGLTNGTSAVTLLDYPG